MDLMPFAVGAFLVQSDYRHDLLLGRPTAYIHAASLWAKMLFVIIAGANAIVFQFTLKDKVLEIGVGRTPRPP